MIQTLLAYVQVVHVGIIIFLTLNLYTYPNQSYDLNLLDLTIAEIALTAIDVFLVRRKLDIIPFFLSFTLLSSHLTPGLDWMVIFFLAKIVYVNGILADARKLLFSGDNCNFCQLGGIVYNFVRFTVVEYMFLGIVITIYKLVVINLDKSGQDLPQNYVLFYQMMVTATTIGYGDVCPKSRIQMYFFIGAIPFICGSFVIYGNSVNPLWQEFMRFWSGQPLKTSKNVFDVSSMPLSEKENIYEFTKLSAQRRRGQQSLKQTYFNDWISISAINYEKNAELIHTIIDSSFSKQIKLSISSRIREQCFPKGWVILDDNDINTDLFMVYEGEIEVNGETKGIGYVFNHQGFFCQSMSGQRVVTRTFVAVCVISLNQLEEIGTNIPKVRCKINQNITAYS